jgi:hypothetical protein
LDGVAQAAQAGVAVRREFRGEQEAVVVARVVGALVGEEGFALGGAAAAEHRAGDDDAVRSAGQGVCVRVRRVDDAQVARGGAAIRLSAGGAEGVELAP